MKKRIKLEALNINPLIYFFGTDEAIEETEAKERKQAEKIAEIITAPGFLALEYRTENGAREILHRSTRPGVFWQLSRIASDGIPESHENYSESDERLLHHIIRPTQDHPQTLTILTA